MKNLKQRNYNKTLLGCLRILYHSAKSRAKTRLKKGRFEAGQCTITMRDIFNTWNKQKGKCYYSGLPMNYESHEWRLSLERLDPSKGYLPNNIVLCCLEFNTIIQWSPEKVDEMVEIVNKNIKENHVDFNFKFTKKSVDEGFEEEHIDDEIFYRCKDCDHQYPIFKLYKLHKKGCPKCREINKSKIDAPRLMKGRIDVAKLSTKLRKTKNIKRQDYSIDIDFNFLVDLFNKQKGLCAYSGIPLQFNSKQNWCISIERIDVQRGYTKDNVCLICREFNTMDQTIKLKDGSYNSSGMSKEKFNIFLESVKIKKGLIKDSEIVPKKEFVKAVYTPKEINKYRDLRARKFRVYNNSVPYIPRVQDKTRKVDFYLLTSPSGKKFIGASWWKSPIYRSIATYLRKRYFKHLNKEVEKYPSTEDYKIKILKTTSNINTNKILEDLIKKYKTHAPYGLNVNPKRKLSEETKKKISETLIGNTVRYDHNGKLLPQYMKYVDHEDRKGYAIISHKMIGSQRKKEYVSKALTLDEKYDMCYRDLMLLNHGIYPENYRVKEPRPRKNP